MPARRPLLAALALALAACARVPGDAVTRCEATQVVPEAVKTDILFVIDDSGSMTEEQKNLSDNLTAFIQALDSAPIANEFQIGVTTTSVADYDGGTTYGTVPYPAGALIAIGRDTSGNPVPGNIVFSGGQFGGSRILVAGTQNIARDFQANVLVGTGGSGKEQPFRAARLAVSDRIADGVNAGFLRPGARLAIVFLSDEDDCSDSVAPFAQSDVDCHAAAWKAPGGGLDEVADFASFLGGSIDGEVRNVIAATIVGVDPATLEPSCKTCPNTACATAYDKAERYAELTQALGTVHTRVASICDLSFRTALEDIAGLLVAQSMPLQGTPADWRMLAVGVGLGTETIPCTVALEGAPDALTADAVYTPPRAGQPATLTFQNDCRLQQGDRARVDVVCAG